MYANMMDLSTHHAPSENPDFGTCRWVSHKYGWIVFCGSAIDETRVPKWLRPAYRYAAVRNCILINFDQAADVYPELQTWEW